LSTETIHTRIWLEEPEADNPFATRAAYCHGYDVYGEMLGQARWVDMLFLLFRGEAPTQGQAALLEALSVALANAGPRDPANHAAMCAGVGGSPAASALMAALAVGAGQYTGAREVVLAMRAWSECGTDLEAWQCRLQRRGEPAQGTWPACDHCPGFDPHAPRMSTIVRRSLDHMERHGARLAWLAAHHETLQHSADGALTLAGVAAAALCDLGFSAEQGEMLYLLLRLPGAAAHALEQRSAGYKNFPFFALELEDDPGAAR
jgi:citrate synthase